ncbi:unnamed protein product [Effrenium voratum]|uniref:Uncharacterized protein n=1 Tax=Effrenium voratum TaxID=2562239 RepID=A0AA36NMI8_9DINO|nr:unnamed protein product [Effrenium voratum]CAJ1409523.1 unnamed protein product [Effrenium voratum]CAJ1412450.1 unnamed protein product [Effrenium voratum]|mmetsp:Transcript_95826/g.228217  ORF Transcript_95826/g.228217 Transcript_95826/m.228217 type:complete len:286 (-) Transcript_95826:79-936(-)
MQPLQLLRFVDAADDGIVLVILRCLGTTALVRLASTSAFVSSRLGDGRPSVLQRYLSELLAGTSGSSEMGALPTLRALSAAGEGRSHCEVLGLALLLATEKASCQDVARMFLDAMFSWELQRRERPRREEAWKAADELLTALFDARTDGGRKLLQITTQAIRQAESDLDALIEAQAETLLSYCGQGYEATARQRSAAEFIRRRTHAFTRMAAVGSDDTMQALESAVNSLDDTIRGYDQEGYTLVCPQLVGWRCLRRRSLPYEHWWVRLDGPFMGRPLEAPTALCM